MRFLIALVCCIVLIGILAKPLKRHPVPFYIVALALVGLYWSNDTNTAGGCGRTCMPLMQRCALAFVLFTIVMFVGVLDESSPLRARLMPIRRQLSILGCSSALGHLAFYGVSYVPRLGSALNGNLGFSLALGGIAGSSDGHPAGHLVPGGEAPHERRALERGATSRLPVLPAHVRAPRIAASAFRICRARDGHRQLGRVLCGSGRLRCAAHAARAAAPSSSSPEHGARQLTARSTFPPSPERAPLPGARSHPRQLSSMSRLKHSFARKHGWLSRIVARKPRNRA